MAECMRGIGSDWKAMTDKEKRVFQDMAKKVNIISPFNHMFLLKCQN